MHWHCHYYSFIKVKFICTKQSTARLLHNSFSFILLVSLRTYLVIHCNNTVIHTKQLNLFHKSDDNNWHYTFIVILEYILPVSDSKAHSNFIHFLNISQLLCLNNIWGAMWFTFNEVIITICRSWNTDNPSSFDFMCISYKD